MDAAAKCPYSAGRFINAIAQWVCVCDSAGDDQNHPSTSHDIMGYFPGVVG